jgi:hypothetical protein
MPPVPVSSRFCTGLGGFAIGFRGCLETSENGRFETIVGRTKESDSSACPSRGLSFRRFEGGTLVVTVSSWSREGCRILSGLKGFDNMTE